MSTAGTIPVAEALSLSGLITPSEGGIASCALAKTGGGNVMLLPSIRVRAPAGVKLLALDCHDDGTPGNAVTMVEVSDDPADVIPRMLGVNHHPEIVNRQRQLVLLEKSARAAVSTSTPCT